MQIIELKIKIGSQSVGFQLEINQSNWNLIHNDSRGVLISGWIDGKRWGVGHVNNKISLFRNEFVAEIEKHLNK